MSVFLAAALKPLALLLLFGVALCGKIAVQRWMRDGKLKRFLLR